ncbi:MAG: hypothetical protein ETSY1_45250 [Candidatus Entotheonella factor]|uniref:Novel STAND NTPase 1 domain-containing protein n=1 Tax=Entotheonella factor TaxID=1429438 RepID=W4L1X0_ENTF1|nr:MAG: hypothetical protein ETSY1_45250 [Candidatus Entotheonella factor]
MIILDQFEELFQYHRQSSDLQTFIDQLSRSISDPNVPVHLIFVMREDFLGELDVFKKTLIRPFENYYRLERLKDDSARAAIEKPVRLVGFGYEKGLVDCLLKDLVVRMQHERSNPSVVYDQEVRYIDLPYLQIVCNAMWKAISDQQKRKAEQDKKTVQKEPEQYLITTAHYEALGGAEKIIRQHFDQVIEQLPFRDQVLAFELFRYLVTALGTKMAYRADILADDQFLGVPVEWVSNILEHLSGRESRILRSEERPDGTWYEGSLRRFLRI